MDGEETEVTNAFHQMSFDDAAECAFSGRTQVTTSVIVDPEFVQQASSLLADAGVCWSVW